MTVDLPNISGTPIHRAVAAQMVAVMSADSTFSGVAIEQVADPKRRLKSMTEGAVLIDCIGVGMRSTPLNRRNFAREYITHAAVRCKLPEAAVTSAILDELGRLSEVVQTFFEDLSRLEFTGASATLVKAEPFVHVARSQLYGDGLFLSPIEFTWKLHR